MQSLAALGFQSEVESAVVLAREAAWSTILVEQAHASGAQLMHRHPQLEASSLVCRATVHNSRTLFYPGVFEKQELRLTSLRDELLKQMDNTKYTGARQAYVQMLVNKCKASRGDTSDHALRRAVMKNHAKQFALLSVSQVEVLKHKANVLNSRRVDTISESLDHVAGQLRLLHERKIASGQAGVVNHVDSIRFGPGDFMRFAELWNEVGPRDLGQLQAPPREIPAPMEKVLQAQMSQLVVEPPPKPDWLSAVVTHRDEYEGCAFYSDATHPDGAVIYKFVVGIHNPHRAIFLQCERVQSSAPVDQQRCDGVVVPVHKSDCYEYNALRFVDHESVPWFGKADIWVLPEVVFSGSGVTVLGWPEPWEVFTRYHHCRRPMPSSTDTPSQPRRRVRVDFDILSALQAEFPWLTLAELETMVTTKAAADKGQSQRFAISCAFGDIAGKQLPLSVQRRSRGREDIVFSPLFNAQATKRA